MGIKISLVGGAGLLNYGDEVILDSWINYIYKKISDPLITIYINNINESNKFYKKKNNNKIDITDNLSKIAWGYGKDLDFFNQVKRGFSFLKNNGIKKYKNNNIEKILDSDVIHLHGGGYLNDYWPCNGFMLGVIAAIHKSYGIPIYGTGLGLGPFNCIWNNEEIEFLLEVISQFVFIETRDIYSFRLLHNKINCKNIYYGLDDCYISPIDKFIKHNYRSSKTLFISFIENDFDKGNYNDLLEKIKNNSNYFSNICFLESSSNSDMFLFKKIKKELPNLEFITINDVFKTGIRVSYEDFIITHRFHHHFLFARSGVNGMYISPSSEYYDVKHGSIIELGSPFVKYTESINFEKIINSTAKESIICQNEITNRLKKIKISEIIYGV